MELYDCTLREGAQAKGAGFSLDDRIKMCQLLDGFGVDYIELGWPVASEDIFQSFKLAMQFVRHAKIVAFGSTSFSKDPTEDKNLRSLVECGAKYACIFGKSDVDHVRLQLKISNQENLEKITRSVEFLRKNGLTVFYDAEHFFDGFKKNPGYALETLVAAAKGGAERLIFCDTNGGTFPDEIKSILKITDEGLTKRGVNVRRGLHPHDDCDLAMANAIAALPYIDQVQGTINGLGERVGNLNLAVFAANYKLKLGRELDVDLKKLKEVSDRSFRLCGVIPPEGTAYTGLKAFAHQGGVHVNAVSKGAGYEHVDPSCVGNKRVIVLNSLGGASSVIEVGNQFGMKLSKNQDGFECKFGNLMEELRGYERTGYDLGGHEAEQFLLLNRHFGNHRDLLDVRAWKSESERYLNGGEGASFYVVCNVNGSQTLVDLKKNSDGGPIDAAFNTLKEVLVKYHPQVRDLHLNDFYVRIANPRDEKSTVRTEVLFRNGEEFSTIGVDENIIGSGVEALAKGFRYHLLRK